jgi:hypothetical protein
MLMGLLLGTWKCSGINSNKSIKNSTLPRVKSEVKNRKEKTTIEKKSD